MPVAKSIRLALGGLCLAGSFATGALAVGGSTTPQARPVVVQTSDGFDWGDAGIGAAAGLGVGLAATGALTLVRKT